MLVLVDAMMLCCGKRGGEEADPREKKNSDPDGRLSLTRRVVVVVREAPVEGLVLGREEESTRCWGSDEKARAIRLASAA